MKKTFIEHLIESDREYSYRIKSVVDFDDTQMEKLERLVQKYELRDMESPRKTIIQDHPLDFPDVNHAEVYIIDIVTGVPVSSYILQQEIRENLKVPEKFIVVRSENDPLEIETEKMLAMKDMRDEAEKKGLERDALLSTSSVYVEDENSVPGEEMYGDIYNKRFLDTLAQISATRSPEFIENKGTGIFSWLNNEVDDVPEIMTDDSFNSGKEYEYAPKPTPWWKASSVDHRLHDDLSLGTAGNFDDDSKLYHQKYKKIDGEEVHMIRKTEGIQDD